MERAIMLDDVIWHGNALNNFLELEDAQLFNFSLQMVRRFRSLISPKNNKRKSAAPNLFKK